MYRTVKTGCKFKQSLNRSLNEEYLYFPYKSKKFALVSLTQIPHPTAEVQHSCMHAACPHILGLRLCGSTGGRLNFKKREQMQIWVSYFRILSWKSPSTHYSHSNSQFHLHSNPHFILLVWDKLNCDSLLYSLNHYSLCSSQLLWW